jgi:biopolymer transport protein ExbD
MKQRREKKKIDRLNLIPILDAIFIFIFFLLMSAQFIDIYEIGSDAPITSTLTQKQEEKKKPLNLSIIINSKSIKIKTGLDNKTLKSFKIINGSFNKIEFQKTLTDLKKAHPKESSVIIQPLNKVKYAQIVKIMDLVKAKGKESQKVELFKNIIFETL